MLAGYESTATALAWTLLEVARHVDVQTRLRKEVIAKSREVLARGDSGFTTSDFDSLPYLSAVIKVCKSKHDNDNPMGFQPGLLSAYVCLASAHSTYCSFVAIGSAPISPTSD